MDLDNLGLLFDTDKCSYGHDYLATYQRLLEPLETQITAILEVGVWNGASLRVWKGAFPKARVVGVDLNLKVQFDLRRLDIPCFEGNQTDPVFMGDIGRKFGPFDFIVDDGSHYHEDQRKCFEIMWPHVKRGGFYFVEDCSSKAPFPTHGFNRVNSKHPGREESHEFLAWRQRTDEE